MDTELESTQTQETSNLAKIGYQAGVHWARRENQEVVARVASMDPGDYTHEDGAYSLAERVAGEALGDAFSREAAVDFWGIECPNDNETMPDDEVVQGFIRGAQSVQSGIEVSETSEPALDRTVGMHVTIILRADATLDMKMVDLVQAKLNRLRWPAGMTAKCTVDSAIRQDHPLYADNFPPRPQPTPNLRLVG